MLCWGNECHAFVDIDEKGTLVKKKKIIEKLWLESFFPLYLWQLPFFSEEFI